MNPRQRLIALAQRLILAMRRSGVQIPEAGPEALWTLAIAVAGWWLYHNNNLLHIPITT